ncbi:MAG: GDSL-type esterase/lipase family protein [Acidimicrobiia bacterium]
MVGGVWIQAHRAAHAPLPEFGDLDVTGHYGDVHSSGAGRLEVAVVGDSTLTGPGLDHAREVFVAQAASRVAVPLHLTRYAVGGSRIADVLMHQLPAVLDARPDLAVMSVGANDAVHSTPLAQYERDVRAVVGARDRAGIETIVCGLIDLSVIPRIPPLLRSMLSRRGVAYERRKARATHPAARAVHIDVGRRVNEVFRARGEEFFTADRFHPNGAGHRCLADALVPHLDAAILRAREARHRATVTKLWPARSRELASSA